MGIQVKIKRLKDIVPIPTAATIGSAGFDIYGYDPVNLNISDYGYVEYRTYIALEIPPGYVGLIYPRSSISKTGLILANSVGVIDSDYRGEILIRFKYIPESKLYTHGDKICQIIFQKTVETEFVNVDELSDTERGDGNFGSTDKPVSDQ